MARQISTIQTNYDWTILGESAWLGDYRIEVKNNTFQAVEYSNEQRIGPKFIWSGYHHWEHGDKLNTAIAFRGRLATNIDPYKGKKLYVVLLSKGQHLDIDAAKVEAALDEFNERCFDIDGPDMEPEKCRILRLLGIDPDEMIDNPRPKDVQEHPKVPAHQAYMIAYIIK